MRQMSTSCVRGPYMESKARSLDAELMLGQRRRRSPINNTALDQRLESSG